MAIDTRLTMVATEGQREDLLFVLTAAIALLWPARPHTLVSCRTDDTRIIEDLIYFRPCEHKRTPTDAILRIELPPLWMIAFRRFWSLSHGFALLFSVDGTSVEGVYNHAFQQFLQQGVQEL